MRRLRSIGPEDLSAREFIERQGYRGRARMLAEMTCTAHLPGTLDQVGLLGLREDGVLTLENGMNYRIAEGYDRLVAHVRSGLEVELGFEVRALSYGPEGGYSYILPGGNGARALLAAADTGALFWAGSATQTSPNRGDRRGRIRERSPRGGRGGPIPRGRRRGPPSRLTARPRRD